MVVREGSSVRATFSSTLGSSQCTSGAGGPGKVIPINPNAATTQRPGVMGAAHVAWGTPTEGPGGSGLGSDLAGGPVDHNDSINASVRTDSTADFELLQHGAILSSGGLGDSKADQSQVNTPVYGSGGDHIDGEAGSAYSEGSKSAQISTDCAQNCPDLAQFCEATYFASNGERSRGLVGTEAGQMDYVSTVVRGTSGPRAGNAITSKVATQQSFPAAGIDAVKSIALPYNCCSEEYCPSLQLLLFRSYVVQ